MAADASIYSLIKPQAQTQGPLDQYGDALKLKSLMGAQSLQDLQMKSAQQGLDDEQAIRSAYQQSGGDPVKLRSLLQGGGNYKQLQALDKFDQDQRKIKGEIDKTGAETGKIKLETTVKAMDLHRNDLANVNTPEQAAQWVMATYNNPHLSEIAQRAGSPQEVIARIPTDPAGFERWKQQGALGMTKFIELNKPTIHMQNTGGMANVVSVPGLGGAPTVASSTPITQSADNLATNATSRANNAATVGATVRGQDLTDTRARLTAEAGRWTNDLERGIQVNMATGETRPITTGGVPMDARDKPLTESQGKATTFGMRAQIASDILDSIGKDGSVQPGLIKRAAEAFPLAGDAAGTALNWTQSSQQQQVEQAQRDFINAVLRLESGAVIGPTEFESGKKQYFPQPGDSAEVIAQKKKNRETEISGLGMMAGPGAKNIKSAPKKGETPMPPETKTVNGKTYTKINGQWYEG